MKFVVVGGGSMGKRRIRCLLANEVPAQDIRSVDTREDRRQEIGEQYGVETLGDFDAALAWGPDAVIISVPGSLHMQFCLAAARARKHVFCEVPLSTSLDGTDELMRLAEQHRLVVAPGCQRPFHPLVGQCKRWIEDPAFGRTMMYQHTAGSWLPDWHPHEDYRKFYASDRSKGGGNLDVIAQELTLAYWLLDDRIDSVFCCGSHLSSLDLNCDDCLQMIGSMRGGIAATMQYDLMNRAGINELRFLSEKGVIELNTKNGGEVCRYLAASKQWEVVKPPADFEGEHCYIDEIKSFLDCVRNGGQWFNALSTAVDVVKFLLAMQQSIVDQSKVNV